MGYFDQPENVEAYIQMAEGYDGRALVQRLRQHLPDGSSVLELGMGPGKDLDLLARHFAVTGSDSSAMFVERYRRQHPDADLLVLDAATLDTDRRFDAIYSNKVLQHLTRQEAAQSFQRQADLLNAGGIVLHSLWVGEGEEESAGLRFVYYTEHTLGALIGDEYEILEIERYTEMEEQDSLFVVLAKVGEAPSIMEAS